MREVKKELYKILVKSRVKDITEFANGVMRVIKGASEK